MRDTNWVRRERPGDRKNKPSAVETLEKIAERIPRDWIDRARNGAAMSCVLLEQDKALLVNAILSALRNERERALRDAARLECVFCAGADGFNPLPVEVEAGNYVHRNEPLNGQAGVYCKASRINALKDGNKDAR